MGEETMVSNAKDFADRKRRLRSARSAGERMQLLLELAQAMFHTDRSQSRRYSAQALNLARRAGDETTAAGTANLLADIARLDGRSSQALRYARQALDSARRAADPRAETDSLNSLGLIYWHRGDCRRAVELFTQCLDRSTRTGDEHLQSRAYNNLSLVNWEEGNLNAAREYQERSLELRQRSGDRYDIGVSQLNMGLIHGDLGDWDKAIECYHRALVELEQAGAATDIALCYNNLGEIYLRRNKLDKAGELLEAAVRKAGEAQSPWAKAEALGNLGELRFRQGELQLARDCYEQDIRLSAEMEDKEELAETWRRMAELHLRNREFEPARKALDTARRLAGRTGVRKEVGNVWRVLGNLLSAQGEAAAAQQAFEQGEKVFQELGSTYELARSRLDLGRALARRGEKEAAAKPLRAAEKVFRRLGAQSELDSAVMALTGIASGMEQALPLAERLLDAAARARSAAELGLHVQEMLRELFGLAPEGVQLGSATVERPTARTRAARAPGLGPELVGADTSLKDILETVRQVAPTRACVLIRGESGTGKELVARRVHAASDRADKPFVAINCAAIPETLLESELFGIEKGTATGVSGRPGKFEQAQGGTVFLDEVGDMSLPLQAKLLRVLQGREIERVGGRRTIPVDIRIIAATSRNLEQAIAQGEFRKDLFYRLNVVPLVLPPLRERRSDIAQFARFFVERYASEYRREPKPLSADALAALREYAWPGNVRELENVMERAVILAREEAITLADLPETLTAGKQSLPDFRAARDRARSDRSGIEKEMLIQTLDRFHWNVTQAAEHLKLSRRHLYRLLSKHAVVRGK